jgi:hypothetical protein
MSSWEVTLAAAAMRARRTVRITTHRVTGAVHLAVMQGDEVIMPIGPGDLSALDEDMIEDIARQFADLHGGIEVTELDVGPINDDAECTAWTC